MFGFHFEKEQKVFQIGDVKVGGQPGENPTVMLASMFHKGDKIVTDRKKREFDKDQATKYIKGQEEASAKFGVPCVVDIVANSGDEFKAYIKKNNQNAHKVDSNLILACDDGITKYRYSSKGLIKV